MLNAKELKLPLVSETTLCHPLYLQWNSHNMFTQQYLMYIHYVLRPASELADKRRVL